MQIVVDALESRQRAAAEVHSLENMKAEADGRLKEKLQELAAVETQSGEAPAIEMQPRAIEARPRIREYIQSGRRRAFAGDSLM